ncbi:MAG: hypothetical protein IT264_02420 [Saprospiraceae bacterium]|nr:hypothetical protein [Saprospiraceae bacterium]
MQPRLFTILIMEIVEVCNLKHPAIKVFNLKTQYQIGCFEPPGLKLTHYLQRKARTSFSSLRQFQAKTHETTLSVALSLPA